MAMTAMVIASTMSATAQNKQTINLPIIQTKYTADPAPYVHGDTVYLYTTHDEDDAEGFKMKDWLNGYGQLAGPRCCGLTARLQVV